MSHGIDRNQALMSCEERSLFMSIRETAAEANRKGHAAEANRSEYLQQKQTEVGISMAFRGHRRNSAPQVHIAQTPEAQPDTRPRHQRHRRSSAPEIIIRDARPVRSRWAGGGTLRGEREIRRRRASVATASELHPTKASSLQKREAKQARKAATPACEGCGTSFGIFCWKHSCSACCQVMCDDCSPHRTTADARLCEGCHIDSVTAVAAEPWKRKLLDSQNLMLGSCAARWQFALDGGAHNTSN